MDIILDDFKGRDHFVKRWMLWHRFIAIKLSKKIKVGTYESLLWEQNTKNLVFAA